MGASNFGRLALASDYFTIGLSDFVKGIECPSCGDNIQEFEIPKDKSIFTCPYCEDHIGEIEIGEVYHTPEEWDIENDMEYLSNNLVEAGATRVNIKNLEDTATFTSKSREYLGVDMALEFGVFIESGYHEGYRTDFKYRLENGNVYDWYNDKDNIESEVREMLTYEGKYKTDKGLEQGIKRAIAFLGKEFDKEVKRINEVLSRSSSTTLKRVGRFDNGETIYEKV